MSDGSRDVVVTNLSGLLYSGLHSFPGFFVVSMRFN